jgi:hypothetical protein
MKQVFPHLQDTDLETFRKTIVESPSTTSAPFADELIALSDRISKMLFDSPLATEIPDVSSLAFFLRASSLKKLRQEWLASFPANCLPMPRGRVFHIAPANVEVMFVYSWVISMLCGNANIVRIPSRPSETIDLLCRCMRDALATAPEIARGQVGVTYEAQNAITQDISKLSNVRVIWGGDETVKSIRALESPAGLRDVVFPNRFSWSAIKASFVQSLSKEHRSELATKFFNDAYLFDQRACSSPQIVVFVGDPALCESAHSQFFSELDDVVRARGYTTDPSQVMEKLGAAALIATKSKTSTLNRTSPELMSIACSYNSDIRMHTCGGGFFAVVYVRSLEELGEMAASSDQTLTHAGFDAGEIKAALKAIQGRGFDRIVPIGQALQFEPIWDGMNLLNEFSRTVRCIV